MEGIFYLAILLLSLAFAIVSVYIAIVLKRLSDTIKSMGNTLGEFEKELQYITPPLKETIRETGATIDDIQEKLNATNNVFDTVDHVGTTVNTTNEFIQSNYTTLSDQEMQEKTKPFQEAIRWSEAALTVFNMFKKTKKSSKKNEIMVQNKTQLVPINPSGREER
ncbi:general stress protein [Oceanobacillus picturae]|jgi:uncharacterized protein YoxC|uniref:General stress protein n=1 Tax=Oceanobacillus picturae TaxID=171693 RepID=W9ADI1_9BACI|nr:DUF948 domain-containing protein [Oceanobacillus picturae]RIU88337.1 DUF948 domain-containing protein [Oceanobacillus picturae]GAQ19584.1 general stress protein [Oceanobacillus picturae]CDO03784.1 putative protein containing a divergent version of the methyl-accepting chemotaxis-like domain protein [Oceanobacillus picturae]